jgi:hypothetical protein
VRFELLETFTVEDAEGGKEHAEHCKSSCNCNCNCYLAREDTESTEKSKSFVLLCALCVLCGKFALAVDRICATA